MRIAVLSDIHGNLTAFEAVLQDVRGLAPDVAVIGGDLVGTGSSPAEVVDKIRELGWPTILGNADEMLWNRAKVDAYFSAPALRKWHTVVNQGIEAITKALGRDRINWLASVPFEYVDHGIAVVHGTRNDCWRAPGPTASDEDLISAYGSFGTSCVIYGHIHHAYVRKVRNLTVVNSGSVGLPYDGDPRAAYAVVEDGRATIRRVAYDTEREVAALRRMNWPDAEWVAEVLRRGAPLPPPEVLDV